MVKTILITRVLYVHV